MKLKLEMVINFIENCDTAIQFTLLLSVIYQFFVYISIFIYTLKYRTHRMNLKCIAYFKDLPIYNKFVFICFTIFCAIPNKIYVNNGIHGFFVSFSIFLIIVLAHIFPVLILLYIMFWIFVLDSYFFAIAYQSISIYSNFVNKQLFNGDTQFSKEYFDFFWGNMSKGGASNGKMGIYGTLLGSIYTAARAAEISYRRSKGQLDLNAYYANPETTKPKNVEEWLAIRRKIENDIVDRETVILKAEKRVQEIGGEFIKWVKDL